MLRIHAGVQGATNALGAIFFSMAYMQFIGLAECAETMLRLPVFYKQKFALFFPAWAYSIPPAIIRIPISVIEITFWSCLVRSSACHLRFLRDHRGRTAADFVVDMCWQIGRLAIPAGGVLIPLSPIVGVLGGRLGDRGWQVRNLISNPEEADHVPHSPVARADTAYRPLCIISLSL
jgi:hypothetical protein